MKVGQRSIGVDYLAYAPAMAANISDHIWTIEELINELGHKGSCINIMSDEDAVELSAGLREIH